MVAGERAPRVAINARAAVRSEIGGVERLARELCARLPALRPDRYQVVEPPPRLAHRLGHLWEQAVLPVRARRCALIYSPANLAPLATRRNVIVVHDLAPLRHPEAFSRCYVTYQRLMLPALARRAKGLITVSEFSKRELVELLGIAPERIAVAPPGVDDRFRPELDSDHVRERHGLRRPYVLAVAAPSRRKNLSVLAAARAALSDRGIDLVLAGSDRGYLRSAEVPLRRLGYVADEDLPALYTGARAFVMPSLYEGFGLPCLEAMACGVPVVAARGGALPETVADAGLLVEADDGSGFADALHAAATDEGLRQRLIGAGQLRAAEFTWERTAALTDAAIAALL